jgi:serine/threonine-protein kinase
VKVIKLSLLTIVMMGLVFIIGYFGTNFTMKLLVGHGNEVLVPNIVNQHFDLARKNLKKKGLYVQSIEQKHSDAVRKGYILTQDPHPNIKTKKNRTIEVVVSLGPEMISVPYLDNITVKEASLRLQNIGLKLGKKHHQYSDDVAKGKIISSRPLADFQVAKGATVDVTVSIGKLPHTEMQEDSKWKQLLDD